MIRKAISPRLATSNFRMGVVTLDMGEEAAGGRVKKVGQLPAAIVCDKAE
jgi:hypothetical protein